MVKSLNFLIAMTFSFPFFTCVQSSGKRLLAVGGTHVLENTGPCEIIKTQPKNAAKNLGWDGQFAFEAQTKGNIQVLCGTEQLSLELVIAEKIDITSIEGKISDDISIGQLIKVKAQLYDRLGRVLEVGKYTSFNWSSTNNLEIANDRSSGEFGFCDTCFGFQQFRATQQGTGVIEVRFDNLSYSMKINIVE
jgi:hypothetical protein